MSRTILVTFASLVGVVAVAAAQDAPVFGVGLELVSANGSRAIESEKICADYAFWSVMSRYMDALRAVDDNYLSERAVDGRFFGVGGLPGPNDQQLCVVSHPFLAGGHWFRRLSSTRHDARRHRYRQPGRRRNGRQSDDE